MLLVQKKGYVSPGAITDHKQNGVKEIPSSDSPGGTSNFFCRKVSEIVTLLENRYSG